MRVINGNGEPVLDVWVVATAPGVESVAIHAEQDVVDGNLAEAFDSMAPQLIAMLRERIVGTGA